MPQGPAALLDRAAGLHRAGKLDEAERLYRKVAASDRRSAPAQHMLGVLAFQRGRCDEARRLIERAIALAPLLPGAHLNLSLVLMREGKLDEAASRLRQALIRQPDEAEALWHLANLHRHGGQVDQAARAYRRMAALQPLRCEAGISLGNLFKEHERQAEALAAYRRVLALRPDHIHALSNIGAILKDRGLAPEATTLLERALAVAPGNGDLRANLLLTLQYGGPWSMAEINARAVALAPNPAAAPEFANRRDPDRILRIGFVSGDFRSHPVGFFLANVLAAHDRSAVECFCYSNVRREDDMTARLRRDADGWRDIHALSDAEAAKRIKADEIDILLDLSGHTNGNRLGIFAGRAAPIQAAWIAYCASTGLAAMDYVLADDHVITAEEEDSFSETVWRLPGSYLCFTPPDYPLHPAPPPVLRNSMVTFGSFNNLAKMSAETIALWAETLRRVENSRLLLKTRSLGDAETCNRMAAKFARHGIAAERLILEGAAPRRDLLAAYGRIDIALDPTPFGGGMTSAEALWMGVPVLTLRARLWAGRLSESILRAAGFAELIAADPSEFMATAADLAADGARLQSLRSSLRGGLLLASDPQAFARKLEAAYRAMWGRWCAAQPLDYGDRLR